MENDLKQTGNCYRVHVVQQMYYTLKLNPNNNRHLLE